MFTIKIDTDNEFFWERGKLPAIRSLLSEINLKLERDITEGKIIDGNGNTVGEFKLGVEK
jgi:hypothetical protein